jgi:hypothetical protein
MRTRLSRISAAIALSSAEVPDHGITLAQAQVPSGRRDTVHDRGYDLLTAEGVFAWGRPPLLIRTQCSFDSVLDFVFVAGVA